MTPYVRLQENVIRVLVSISERNEYNQKHLLRLIRNCRVCGQSGELDAWTWNSLIDNIPGLVIPDALSAAYDHKAVKRMVTDIILEQVDDSVSPVQIRNLLGTKFSCRAHPQTFAEFAKAKGSGDNWLRTERLAQPRVLKEGDVLADGSRVLCEPREGGNGSVLLKLTGGRDGHWIEVASRLPIALLTADDETPESLID